MNLRTFLVPRICRLSRFPVVWCVIGAAVFGPLQVFAQAPTPTPPPGSAAEIKRIADRYALTRKRIDSLLQLRQQPVPIPANPPNPFYQSPVTEVPVTPGGTPEEVVVPEAADITDADALRKYAATLKIGGIITRNDVVHLTINNTASKVGDIITVGPRSNPVYLKLLELNPADFTLGLNEATLTVPIRK